MPLYYSHSYEDPDTGEVVDVMVDHDDDDGLRNARRVSRQPTVVRGTTTRTPTRPGSMVPRPRPTAPVYSPAPPVYSPAPPIYAPGPVPRDPRAVVMSGEHISIRKGALLEVVPAIGKVWASLLGMPAAPKATGNDITDRDNAASHREALAQHTQNQTRILALTELAAQVVGAFVR